MRKRLFILLALIAAFTADLRGQNNATGPVIIGGKYALEYVVNGKDTMFVDELPPARIHPRQTMSRRDWFKYYKRVHNFSKSYPYALFIAKTIRETDSIFVARNYNKRQQERYLDDMKEDLIRDFNPIFRNLSLKQGLMMIRLIDMEVGMEPYYIIEKYLGRINSGFWQGVAKLFGGNLKKGYEPKGEDADLEELVAIWHKGEFEDLYDMVFGRPLPEIYIPEAFREPYYKWLEENHSRKGGKKSSAIAADILKEAQKEAKGNKKEKSNK
ncbi:MAG: DUF4294 domain-containing protein [Bacteroidales bacterium]|nr:DUF4294 domain-containing protein [Bacteroidales bacterium]